MAGEWTMRPFGELLAMPLKNGLTKPTAVRGSGIKMVNMGELFAHSRIGNVPMDRVPMSPKEMETYLLQEGDLLFARQSLVLSGAGKCSFFLGSSEPVTYEGHLIRARLDAEVADPQFYYYYLNTSSGRNAIESIIEQVAAAGIRGSDLARLPVAYPPLTTQRAIAHILGTLDDKIELNRRMNATLEEMARALFKSWFVDFDPVRAKMEGRETGLPAEVADLFPDGFAGSAVGEVPRGWRVGTLSDFAALNPENWSKATRPAFIRYVDLTNTKWGRIEAVTEYAHQDAPSRAQRVLRPGDTIIGTVRPGNASFAYVSEGGLTGSTGFAVLRPRKNQYQEFVYLAGTAGDNIETLAHLADGGAYPAVRPEVVTSTQIVCPPDVILLVFARSTSPLLAKMAQNERESRSLAALRDTLLPKLISGEVRVPDAERLVEAAT